MRLVRVWLGEYHCCSVLSELLKRGLEPCVSGWGGGVISRDGVKFEDFTIAGRSSDHWNS